MFLKWTRVFSTNFPPLWSLILFFSKPCTWMIFDNWWNSGETLRESERWGPNQCSSRKKWESCLWPGKNHYTLYTTQGRTNVALYTLQYSIHYTLHREEPLYTIHYTGKNHYTLDYTAQGRTNVALYTLHPTTLHWEEPTLPRLLPPAPEKWF